MFSLFVTYIYPNLKIQHEIDGQHSDDATYSRPHSEVHYQQHHGPQQQQSHQQQIYQHQQAQQQYQPHQQQYQPQQQQQQPLHHQQQHIQYVTIQPEQHSEDIQSNWHTYKAYLKKRSL